MRTLALLALGRSRTTPVREAPRPMEVPFRLRPDRVFKLLAGMIGLLVAMSILGDLLIAMVGVDSESPLRSLAGRFVVDSELNLPTWYSSMTLLACGVLLAAIAAAQRHVDRGQWKKWALLAAIFAAMSLDEVASLHEMPSGPVRRALALDGILRFGWVVLALPAVLIVGCAYAPFLWRLPARTRNLFLFAATCYVGGALGMELVGGYLAEQYGMRAVLYVMAATVEETLEMIGVAVFLFALLDYIGRRQFSWSIGVSAPPAGESSAT
ncbi:MAG: hypothetical protein WD030_09075 [Pirellulales bacterium]